MPMMVCDLMEILSRKDLGLEVYVEGRFSESGSRYKLSLRIDPDECEWRQDGKELIIDFTPADAIAYQSDGDDEDEDEDEDD